MHIGIRGTGTVGHTLGMKLLELGHNVTMGARAEGNAKANAFVDAAAQEKLNGTARAGTFYTAGAVGDLVINCTSGEGSVAAVKAADAKNLAGKILIDVANPLDFSKGFPPSLTVMNTDSLGEQLQRLVPDTRVVKALNTLTAELMVNPAALGGGDHDLLMCGNDVAAKAQVRALLETFGWRTIVDVGDITAARGTEAWLLLWTRLYGALKTPRFNLKLVQK